MSDPDRGPDPRPHVTATLAMLSRWGEVDWTDIGADVAQMHPDDTTCAFCGEPECLAGCPMLRWRGQQ